MERGRVVSAACLAGPAAVALAWIVIVVSVALNPWFSLWSNAFSDLGGPSANDPWVYNYGMISVASLIVIYGGCMVMGGLNRLHYVGGSFFMVAGLFLALVGVYHEGTYPHVFVSHWFFYQSDLSVLAWGLGSIRAQSRFTGCLELSIAVVGPIVAAALRWPSAATLEAYGIVLIDAFALLVYAELAGSITRPSSRPRGGTSASGRSRPSS